MIYACGGGGDSPTPTPAASPTPSPEIITPAPTAAPPTTGYRLVYREAGALEDVIWSVSPSDVSEKAQLAVIPHREGYPVRASVSPDGTFIAYLSLPESALSVDSSQAEAFVMDLTLEGAPVTKVAEGVDFNFTPLWSPDGGLIYLRRYAGPEFLNSVQTIVRVRVVDAPDPAVRTPRPTPTLEPGIEPWPGPDGTVLRATVANVLRWTPIGFADDGRSMFFLEEKGGTRGSTLAGIYAPATTREVDALYASAEAAWYGAQRANKEAADAAAAAGLPPPSELATPAPTAAPSSRFVLELSDQSVQGASLSPDMQRVAYLNQVISEFGEFKRETFVADMVTAKAAALPMPGLSPGSHLAPCWFPDGRLTVSVLPEWGGPGQMAILALDGSSVALLAQTESGFDVPRSWAGDGTWLAALHWSGSSLVDQGEGRLDLISVNGHRVTLLEGSQNAGEDSVLGWVPPPAAEPGG